MNLKLLLVGLTAGVAYSIYSAMSKSLLKSRVSTPLLLLLYINLAQALVTPLLWFMVAPSMPSAEGWVPLGISGVLSVIGSLFFYLAISCGDVSSVTPIMGSKVIFAGLLAVPMLAERHAWPVYLSAVLVAIAIALLSYSPSKHVSTKFPLKPIVLMLSCCVLFAFTDIYIKRSLLFIDAFNFMVYYNLILGVGSLGVIPYLRKHGVSMKLPFSTLMLITFVGASMVLASLLFVITFNMAEGVVIPNILIASRGMFIVIISAIGTHWGVQSLDVQSKRVYGLRLAASALIIVSIWLAMHR